MTSLTRKGSVRGVACILGILGITHNSRRLDIVQTGGSFPEAGSSHLSSTMTSTLDPTFLGLDLSTQQLKAALVTKDGKLLYEQSVHFDRDLARFGTTNGAIRGDEDGEVYCPVVLWIAAFDLLMDRLKASGKVDFSRIRAIGGAAQVGSNSTTNTTLI